MKALLINGPPHSLNMYQDLHAPSLPVMLLPLADVLRLKAWTVCLAKLCHALNPKPLNPKPFGRRAVSGAVGSAPCVLSIALPGIQHCSTGWFCAERMSTRTLTAHSCCMHTA